MPRLMSGSYPICVREPVLRELLGTASGELLDDADEVRVLEARDEEGPPTRPLLVGADLVSFGLAEGTAGGELQRVDVELDLLSEQPVDGAAQLE